MSLEVQALVIALLAACLGAGQKFWLKATNERLILLGSTNLIALIFSIALLPFLPPMNLAAFPFLVLSTGIYTIFVIYEIRAYSENDLSLVEPLQKAIRYSLLFLYSALFLGENAGIIEMMALGCLLFGCLFLMDWSHLKTQSRCNIGVCFVAAFLASLLLLSDIFGIRASGEPLTYIVWNLWMGIPVIGLALARHRKQIRGFLREKWFNVSVMTVCDVGAYGAIIYILYILDVGSVLPLVNIGTILSALMAYIFLKEHITGKRWVAIFAIVVSVSLVQLY